ncbi:hypothetical protein NKG94_06075 [Micromonospora sp. M12]
MTGLMWRWQTAIAEGIRAMQSTGDVAADLDADRAAAALLAGIQGGVLLLLSTGKIDHLEAVLDLTIDSLRAGARSDRPQERPDDE